MGELYLIVETQVFEFYGSNQKELIAGNRRVPVARRIEFKGGDCLPNNPTTCGN
jgi:hypothetical protein